MKVVMTTKVVYPFHSYGGMQKYVYSLAKSLAKVGVDVTIISSLPDRYSPAMENRKFEGINYIFLPPCFEGGIGYFKRFLFSWRVAHYISSLNAWDLIHDFGGITLFYLIFNKTKPVIMQGFGLEPFHTENLEKRIINYAKFYLTTKVCFSRADLIASEGEHQTQDHINLFKASKEKIFNLPDGVDLCSIDSFLKKQNISRQSIGINDKDFVIVNVNRLAKNKGVSYLIKALPILKKQISNLKVIMIGTGPEEKKIISLVKKLNLEDVVCHFRNISSDDLFQYYRLGDVFVCPTLHEGLPIVVLEAMACGLPIIATDTSENPQVVKNGINGYLVLPASVEGIVKGVIKVWQNKNRREMGIQSKKIVKKYDWSIIAKMAIKKYEELLRKRKVKR